MYSSGGSSTKKHRPTGYLARPKLGALKSLFSNRPLSALSNEKRKKSKKSATSQQGKMDFRRKPDYADTAYREAVGRLRILMAESYTPVKRLYGQKIGRELDSAGEETDNLSVASGISKNSRFGRYYNFHYNPSVTPRKHYYPPAKPNIGTFQTNEKLSGQQESPKLDAPPELMTFIERQEDYIEQLEKESRFCKDELSSLLSKVKEVISENEQLHDKQRSKLMKSVFDHLETETEAETDLEPPERSHALRRSKLIEGPSIVFESRISELEAQLTQSRIDLKKAQEDNELLKKKLSEAPFGEGDTYKKQLDTCNRDKEELLTKLKTLQSALSALRDKENDTCDQVKRSLDVAEQAQYEKSAAELEIRRLKDELERQHGKLRDAIAEQGRRIADERSAVERRYTQQMEKLTAEVDVQWETINKLQLELDKQRRDNADLRRECAQKQALMDEQKKEMQNKILTLQSDIGMTGVEKSELEQQIATLNMTHERAERQHKQEVTRLQAEIQSLRQGLDRADADLIHSRRENIRLKEQIGSLEKELKLNAALSDERSKSATAPVPLPLPAPAPAINDEREKVLSSMIQDMEIKHAATVAELETMIHSQNQLMDKLSSECCALTRKLDDSSNRHKEEIRELQTNLDQLSNRFSQAQNSAREEKPATKSQPQTSPQNKILKRTESRSSLLKAKNRTPSKQPSQEKSPIKAAPASQTPISEQYESVSQQEQYPKVQYSEDNYQQYVTDPSQQYAENMNQYQYDPNVHYDSNQQYQQEYDPNQMYDTDANQYLPDQSQLYYEQNPGYATVDVLPQNPSDESDKP